MILCIILLNSAIAIGNSVDVKKYVSSVTSFDFVVASPNTFSNVQGFRFKDDSVIGNRSFIVEPVFKEESSQTLGEVLLRLMKSESEKL